MKDGILLVNKPENITSNDLVLKIKKYLNLKAGHTGTLDYAATGLMIITLQKAVKITPYLQNLDKEYIAVGELGKITDTYDRNGRIIEEREVNITEEKLIDVIKSFKKSYYQMPPPYSAKRIKGKRAYQFAKKGEEPDLKPKFVHIYDIQILEISLPFFTIKINCSSGTYIRSIIKEIGDEVGTGAYLKALQRTKIGKFSLQESINLEDLLKMKPEEVEAHIIPITDALYFMDSVILDEMLIDRFTKGQRLKIDKENKEFVKVLDKNLNTVGIGKIEDGILKPIRII
ncbi:tRNA pseudouridine(55) synthase TruB [Venenivibrio stagnispumantis]|uniref:tRNA pseudouridine synthase B n=1 Tax=Venenivibrio stagnispumantis TaxID=407998 RepID=A0AA45WJ93_9AQUI|nr:tRNA pseudouridine(55) synthase TruB [Venenivibrio stagnispumantis]MCW4572476.1 tRNA pseudouridine(55) synthase TruB [Venenivibrio stagnispumantis]SMP02402.1 tRNA pseudouridine55 synthase [Venenivibrio stagnispumantis]